MFCFSVDNELILCYNKPCVGYKRIYRGIAQLVEQRSPKPRAEGSSPSAPVDKKSSKTACNSGF